MNIIIVIVAIIVFIILNLLYKNTNYFKNQYKQIKKFKDVPNNLEIINLGSSYAKYAFDYKCANINGFNFALQPQSLSYDFKILKQYTPNLKKGCIVQIILPNLVFGFLDYKNDMANTKYYYFLNPKDIINYSKFKYLIRVRLPIVNARRGVRYLIKDTVSNDYDNQLKNPMTEDEVICEAKLRVEGWKKQFCINSMLECNYPKELENMFSVIVKIVSEMIEYCIKNEFKPVLIVPPTSGMLNNMISKKFMQDCLYSNIEKANKKNVPVLDYLYDERFQDYKLYLNSDFLNKTGSEKFTKVVLSDLKKLGLIGGKHYDKAEKFEDNFVNIS